MMYLVYSVYSYTVLSRFLAHSEYIRIHREYTAMYQMYFLITEYRQKDIKYIKYTDFEIHFRFFSLTEKKKNPKKFQVLKFNFCWEQASPVSVHFGIILKSYTCSFS